MRTNGDTAQSKLCGNVRVAVCLLIRREQPVVAHTEFIRQRRREEVCFADNAALAIVRDRAAGPKSAAVQDAERWLRIRWIVRVAVAPESLVLRGWVEVESQIIL